MADIEFPQLRTFHKCVKIGVEYFADFTSVKMMADGIARKLDASYSDGQEVGHKLQDMRLAHVSVIPYDGSAIFLNVRGEAVKSAVNALLRVRLRRLIIKHGGSS